MNESPKMRIFKAARQYDYFMTNFESYLKSMCYGLFWTFVLNLLASRPENSEVREPLCINDFRLRAGNGLADQ